MDFSEIERTILETPIVRERIPYRGELEDEIEVDDGLATLKTAAARVRDLLKPKDKKMNFAEYHATAKALSARPPVSDHPEGQKFRIGEQVRIVNPQSWFAKREIGNVFTVEYSYHQKYPEMSDGDRHKREYSLLGEDGNSTSWYDEEELESVEAGGRKKMKCCHHEHQAATHIVEIACAPVCEECARAEHANGLVVLRLIEEEFREFNAQTPLEDLHNWVFCDLGFCGCGDPEGALELLRDTLSLLNKEFDERWDEIKKRFPDDPMAWTYLYFLDDNGLTEHGSNIRGCWLTEHGKGVLAALNAYTIEQIIEGDEDAESVLDAKVIG